MEGKYFVVGVVAAAFIVVLGMIYMSSPTSGQTVQATGFSEITAQPDKVVVYFNVESTKQNAEDARDDVSGIVAELENSLLDIVDSDEIETQSYNIYEEYDWTNNGRVFKGYTARQVVEVSSEDFEKAGRIVDKGVDAGALVQYINFELTQEHENELKAQALEEAAADAKVKAEATATGLGAKLGKVVSVNSNDFYYDPYRYYDYAVAEDKTASEAASNIQPKSLDITASVNVVYKLR